ncbi:hypothetical protein D6764_05110 [Candidatus Woesearchaeota archaeon]|nr:MAG: hypothetical protein D6764_05110 [Candidatus Woesearchaeota archaeon]
MSRILKNKKGEETTSAPSMTTIMLPLGGILLLITIGFIWVLITGSTNDSDEVSAVTTFQIIGEEIAKMLKGDAMFSMNEDNPLVLPDGYVIVGFDTGPAEMTVVKGSTDPQKRDANLIFQKPDICMNNACLCLFKDIPTGTPGSSFQTDEREYSTNDLATGCYIYPEKVKFVSVDKGPSLSDNHEPVSLGWKEKNPGYPIDEASGTGALLSRPSAYQDNEGRYTELVVSGSYGNMWNAGKYGKAYIDVWNWKDSKGEQVGSSSAVVFLSYHNTLAEKRKEALLPRIQKFKCKTSESDNPEETKCIDKDGNEVNGCSYCACGAELRGPKQFCCPIPTQDMKGHHFVSNIPCECYEKQIKACSDYSTPEECEKDECHAGSFYKCGWNNGACYKVVDVLDEYGNERKMYVED